MNDEAIRRHLHQQLLSHHHRDSSALVIDELGLHHGTCRADIAVVNGRIIGFEIKGETDSLKRLPQQVKAYSSVFDEATVVTTPKHQRDVIAAVPKWWGVIICHPKGRHRILFEVTRVAQPNGRVSPVAVARLLWKNEVANILARLGEPKKALRQPRAKLYERLAELLPLTQLQRRVRNCLKRRKNWRDRERLSPNDDLFRPTAR
jgi:hypothetical protein